MKSVAEALHESHPNYYFLIDRDHHHCDKVVNSSWQNFPDTQNHNLLIWKYREIENYFLVPEYLENSDYLKVKRSVLESEIESLCNQRLFLDVTNYVIVSIRENLKKNWIKIFTNPADFCSRDQALEKLHDAKEFKDFKNKLDTVINQDEIERRFDKLLKDMTGGVEQLVFGKGKWIKMTQGKEVLSQIINSDLFKVIDNNKKTLQGKNKFNQVIKNLLKKDIKIQPKDFRELKELVKKQLR